MCQYFVLQVNTFSCSVVMKSQMTWTSFSVDHRSKPRALKYPNLVVKISRQSQVLQSPSSWSQITTSCLGHRNQPLLSWSQTLPPPQPISATASSTGVQSPCVSPSQRPSAPQPEPFKSRDLRLNPPGAMVHGARPHPALQSFARDLHHVLPRARRLLEV